MGWKEGGGEGVEFEERRRGMLTTGEWYNPDSNMLHHVYKELSRDWS